MKLSVVIVNYNVKYFLEQCLQSVRVAMKEIEGEVFVVDNNSVDGSVALVQKKFPEVQLIKNNENYGFSKANNQAISQAKGDYILLLNPDTLVEEDTFTKCVDYLDKNEKAGALGVKMIDGKGDFLPESKRGLPKPNVAFYKMFGLSKLFPRSKKFGKYHLTYLDKNEIHNVDVLSGAFMMLRKTVIDEIGMLDETFFMYGEDIDLSYRIKKAGYQNVYFPKTRIIHYKGESTKKNSVNYVFVFYNAMIIFAKKHFTQKKARLFSFLIKSAIYFRATLSLVFRFVKRIFLPLLDASLIFAGMLLIKNYWEKTVVFPEGGNYPIELITIVLPSYIFIWLVANYFSGGYDKPILFRKIIRGVVIGSFFILVVYALLDESMRFSRALILIGTVWVLIVMLFNRVLFQLLGFKSYRIGENRYKRYLIVGENEEVKRVEKVLRSAVLVPDFVGMISNKTEERQNGFLANINQLTEIIQIYKINEVIFCAKSMSSQEIIDKMSELQSTNVEYKIAPPESISIIGTNSINASDDLYVINLNSVSDVVNKRNKRFFDMVSSIFFLALWPLSLVFVRKPFRFLFNIFCVFFGTRTWVSYAEYSSESATLPKLKKGILNTADSIKNKDLNKDIISRLNINYARNYKVWNDFNAVIKSINKMGRDL
jgi:GT2 family glycosyltransferase